MSPQQKNFENFEIYNYSKIYNPQTISVLPDPTNSSCAHRHLEIKLETLGEYISKDKSVLDMGCANGVHLKSIYDKIKQGFGVDFSARFIDFANDSVEQADIKNLNFIKSTFDNTGLESNSIDVVYSFSSLYYVTEGIENVFNEIHRVLKQDGIAILDLGNSRSLLKIVSNHTDGVSKVGPYSIDFMTRELSKYFTICSQRSFQLFPMWGNKPWYIAPFLNRFMPSILKIQVAGKMLDEWISSLPIIRRCAFRHILVLKRK